MVRDENSSGDNQHGQPAEQQHGTGDLTQELAQLLAASLAQKGLPKGTPTGADLASLASLISQASAHRTIAPAFKDGLSALAYTPPRGAPGIGNPGLGGDYHHDDEPMPIPSTWRQPNTGDDERWFRQQLGAAFLGLVAGLMIVVPTVLWLSGWIGGSKSRPTVTATAPATPARDTRATDIKTVKVQVRPVEKSETASQYMTASVDPRPAETARQPELAPAAAVTIPPQRSRTDDLIAQAERRIENGDVIGAREILGSIESATPGPASFALAETYDPNMLAAWGTRGVSADVARARALYLKALDLGVARAQARLDALK